MHLSVSLLSWLNYFVLFQGLLFGTMLIFLHSKDSKPTFFLGVFVLLFSVGALSQTFLVNYIKITRDWEFISLSFYLLSYPFFYLYVQRVSVLEHRWICYWTFVPAIIGLIIVLFLCFLPIESVLLLKSTLLYIAYIILAFSYCIYISLIMIRRISFYSKVFDNKCDSESEKSLTWIKWFVLAFLFYYFLKILNLTIFRDFNEVLLLLISVSLIYSLTFKAIIQKTIEPLVSHKVIHQDLMSENEAIQLLGTVEAYIAKSNCYVNVSYTIVDLAEAIQVHPKRISYAINSIKGIHFNKYINFFRVNYAKVLLKSNAVRQLSIEGIGMEAGFHSKTTFYKAFKSFEGMTPAKYKIS